MRAFSHFTGVNLILGDAAFAIYELSSTSSFQSTAFHNIFCTVMDFICKWDTLIFRFEHSHELKQVEVCEPVS